LKKLRVFDEMKGRERWKRMVENAGKHLKIISQDIDG
jgi:hypothetical protein